MDLTKNTCRCVTCNSFTYRHHRNKITIVNLGGPQKIEVATYHCIKCKKYFRHPDLYKITPRKKCKYTKEVFDLITKMRENSTLKATSDYMLKKFNISIPPSTINFWEREKWAT